LTSLKSTTNARIRTSAFSLIAVVLRRRSPVRFEIGAATVDPQARLPKIADHSRFPPFN
jgi:hypothetical protein